MSTIYGEGYVADLRRKSTRDYALLAQIKREGGFSVDWLVGNRDNAASLHRLIASGEVRIAGSGWIAVEQERSWRDNLRAFVARVGL
jgi:hypothetical protein